MRVGAACSPTPAICHLPIVPRSPHTHILLSPERGGRASTGVSCEPTNNSGALSVSDHLGELFLSTPVPQACRHLRYFAGASSSPERPSPYPSDLSSNITLSEGLDWALLLHLPHFFFLSENSDYSSFICIYLWGALIKAHLPSRRHDCTHHLAPSLAHSRCS